MGKNFDTKSVHFTEKKGSSSFSSKTTPIYQTSAFSFKSLQELESFFEGEQPYLYTRVGNPNTDELGKAAAYLEEAPAGVAASSGMSAILAGVLAVVEAGDHIIAAEDVYGGTYQLFAHELKSLGIDVTFVPFHHLDAIKGALKPNTKLLYTESVTNPLLRVEDIEQIVEVAKENDLYTMVDNTFATPYVLRPYMLGVNLVVHSATKYIGGHSDVTAGVVVGDEDLIQKATAKVVNLGSSLSPFESWLACRGLKTLSVRMERHCMNAQSLANALNSHRAVKKVYYPKYVSEKGNGAIVTIELSHECNVDTFVEKLNWVKIVPSLAGVETTISYPIGTSHRALPKDVCERLGINKYVIRISVGIEHSDDIISVFEKALHASINEHMNK